MKFFRKALFITALSLLSGSLSAQQIDLSQNVIVQGKAGKQIVFRSIPMPEMHLSRNGKFLTGRSEYEGEDLGGVIYDIEKDSIKFMTSSVLDVIDWNNYATTSYVVIDGKEYYDFMKLRNDWNSFVIEEASADLLTLRAGLYITRKGADWSNIIIDTKTGRVLDTLRDLDPSYPLGGKINMGWAMSDDAKIVVGRASLKGAPVNISPTFWDRDKDSVYFPGYKYTNDNGKELLSSGELWDINGSGTLICGVISERACVFSYNRTTGTRGPVKYLDLSPGYDQSTAYKMNESGMVVGTEQMGIDIYSRRAFIYNTEKDQKYILSEYLKDLYGLDAEQDIPLFTPLSISDDGRRISGYGYGADEDWYAYLILLDEHQIYAPVRNVQVQNIPRRSSNVVVSWQEPLPGEYTLTGYNVFCDKQQVNAQPIPVGTLSFKHENVPNGKHRYFVQAVYGDSVSDAFDTLSIFVADPTSCLPIQEIFSNVEYNRTVSLMWGLPSDQENSNVISRPKKPVAKYIPQKGLDFVSVFQPRSSRMSTGIRIGDYIYAGSYEESGIFVYDVFGNTIRHITISGVGNIYDMTYHDGSLYVATGQERVIQLDMDSKDPFNIGFATQFVTSLNINKAVSIAYVENDDKSINDGQDYLIVGDYYNLVAYPHNATGPNEEFKLPVNINIDGMHVSGSEYYKGRLYLANQNGGNGCDLVAYDMATGEKLFTTDLYAHPTVVDASNNPTGASGAVYTGGLIKSTLPDGTVVLECLVQCQYTYNMIVDMEVESASDVLGYVVYRNNEKVSDTLHSRHFTQIIDEPGKYTYYVEYLSTRGCHSLSNEMDVTRTEEIYEKGECIAPREMKVYESDKKAVLSWSEECFKEEGFVGFNLYRNGEQIGEKRFLGLRYTDADVELGTEYVYRLEAFYDKSCVASDSVKITLNGKGAAREPAAFNVEATEKADKTIDAKATWGIPYFEEPMAYGYCNFPVSTDFIKESSQIFCIVGWTHEDMDKFAEDLYLVGVEFMLGASSNSRAINAFNTVVYVNDDLVYNKPCEERFQAREWVQVYFDKVFKMRQRSEIAVGYSVSYDPSAVGQQEGIFVFDMGPRTKTKSDLISLDGREFGTVYAVSKGALDVNLCINALVVRLRDLADAASAIDPQAYMMSKAMRMDLKAELAPVQNFTDAPKASSEGIKLLGFNLYRDGKKLNENLMTEKMSYEENVARGEYDYEVEAVYENADALKASFFADFTRVGIEDLEQAYGVSVYPNPASDRLNIKGVYASFSLVDMNGRVLMRDVRNTESVSLADLNNGVYFVLITLPNGDKRAVKVIKR